jgi:hypothetical protein
MLRDMSNAEEVQHLKDLLLEWSGKLQKAGADLDLDHIDREQLVEVAREVFHEMCLVVHEGE